MFSRQLSGEDLRILRNILETPNGRKEDIEGLSFSNQFGLEYRRQGNYQLELVECLVASEFIGQVRFQV